MDTPTTAIAAMNPNMIVVLIGAALVFALFLINVFYTAKTGRESRLLSRATYGLACIVAVYNIWRCHGDESSGTILVANAVALVCILISFHRSESTSGQTPAGEGDGNTV